MATPFVGNIVISYAKGTRESLPATMSDVTAEEWVAPDGTDFFHVRSDLGQPVITDILLNNAGASVRTSTIRVNGKAIPDVVLHGANVGTVVGRQFQQTPIAVPPGAQIEFTQLT